MIINSDTTLYGVFGNPVSHSLSPVMHNTAFDFVGHNGVYLAFKVTDIAAGVAGIKELGIKGVSITIPHKVSIMPFLEEMDELSRNIGAVNTIVNENGKLYGYNSDCKGAIQALRDQTSIKGEDVVIIGAGGAARAIGYGILSEGGKLTIINRTVEKGERLATALGADFFPLSEFKKPKCRILINTTSLGMTPDIETTPVKQKNLDRNMIIMDIVYNPLKTRFLKEAAEIGCLTVDGACMFVYQGAYQFELWTGLKAPVNVMKKAVLDAL